LGCLLCFNEALNVSHELIANGFETHKWAFDWLEFTERGQVRLQAMGNGANGPNVCATCSQLTYERNTHVQISAILNGVFLLHG
jgi:hypothetical protein